MRQDAFDHGGVCDRGNHFHLPATGLTGVYLDLEYPLESLCPRHRRVAIDWGLLRTRRWTLTATRGRHLLTQMMIGRANSYQWPVIAGEVYTGIRHQGGEPSDKVQRLEHPVGGAIPVRRLQSVMDEALGR